MNTRIILCLVVALGLLGSASSVHAAGAGEKPPELEWSFDGLFGTFDRAQLQRGFQVYRTVCAACHSLERIPFRQLSALGYSEGQIKAIAMDYMVEDGLNDEGDMFMRAARAGDNFPSPYPNKKAAQFANNGAYPPDLSLIVNARAGGADYISALMTGYEDHAPEGYELMTGQHWNKYMPGHVISMPPPLVDGQVMYEEEGIPQTAQQYAEDVSAFLAWTANPDMELRKRTGIKAFIFLLAFTLIMYAVKKKVWKDAH